jgi:hypothetical protein
MKRSDPKWADWVIVAGFVYLLLFLLRHFFGWHPFGTCVGGGLEVFRALLGLGCARM